MHILRATIDRLRVRLSSIISVGNNSASGRKHLYIPGFLAVSCIFLVYEGRNLDQNSPLLPFNSWQGLATLHLEVRVLTGSQQDRWLLHNNCVESGKSGCLSRRIKSTSFDLVWLVKFDRRIRKTFVITKELRKENRWHPTHSQFEIPGVRSDRDRVTVVCQNNFLQSRVGLVIFWDTKIWDYTSYAVEVVTSGFSWQHNCFPDSTQLLCNTHLSCRLPIESHH